MLISMFPDIFSIKPANYIGASGGGGGEGRARRMPPMGPSVRGCNPNLWNAGLTGVGE